jgi:hypothetical protein
MVPKKLLPGVVVTLTGDGGSRGMVPTIFRNLTTFFDIQFKSAVKLGNKERFDKEQIGIKEPFPVTTMPFTSQG